MLSKKNYEKVAEILRSEKKSRFLTIEREAGINRIVESLAEYFEEDNPKFDRGKFINACEIGE